MCVVKSPHLNIGSKVQSLCIFYTIITITMLKNRKLSTKNKEKKTYK
jgi:hypothetical protein